MGCDSTFRVFSTRKACLSKAIASPWPTRTPDLLAVDPRSVRGAQILHEEDFALNLDPRVLADTRTSFRRDRWSSRALREDLLRIATFPPTSMRVQTGLSAATAATAEVAVLAGMTVATGVQQGTVRDRWPWPRGRL